MVEAVRAGREPDPKYGAIGKQLSGTTRTSRCPWCSRCWRTTTPWPSPSHAWLVLVAMTLAGALIRVWFVMRHKHKAKWWVSRRAAVMTAAAALMAPKKEKEIMGRQIAFTD